MVMATCWGRARGFSATRSTVWTIVSKTGCPIPHAWTVPYRKSKFSPWGWPPISRLIRVSGENADGVAVLTTAATGDFAGEPVAALGEFLLAFHGLGAGLDQLAVGVDAAMIQFNGHVVGLDLAEPQLGSDVDLGTDGQFGSFTGLNLFDSDAAPALGQRSLPL